MSCERNTATCVGHERAGTEEVQDGEQRLECRVPAVRENEGCGRGCWAPLLLIIITGCQQLCGPTRNALRNRCGKVGERQCTEW